MVSRAARISRTLVRRARGVSAPPIDYTVKAGQPMIQGMKFVSSTKGPTLRSKGAVKYAATTQPLDIIVPEGATPGQQLTLTHNGQKVLVAVPEGVAPGGKFTVNIPGPKTKKGSWRGMMNGRVLTVDGTSARPYTGDALTEYLRANADRDRVLTIMRKADKKLADEAETEAGAIKMRKAVAVSKSYDELNFCSSKDLSGTFDDLYKRRAFSKLFIDEVFKSLIAPFRGSRYWFKCVLLFEGALFSICTTLPLTDVGKVYGGLSVSIVFFVVMLYMQPYNETDKTDDDPDLTQWRRVMNYLESNKCNRTDLSTRLSTIFNLTFGAVIVSAYMEKYEDAEEYAKDAAFQAVQALVFVDLIIINSVYLFMLDTKSWFKKTYTFLRDTYIQTQVASWRELYIMKHLTTTFLERTITKLHLIYTTTKQNTLLAKYHKSAFVGRNMKTSPRDLGFLAVELKRAGYSVADCEKAGWSLRSKPALVNIRKVRALLRAPALTVSAPNGLRVSRVLARTGGVHHDRLQGGGRNPSRARRGGLLHAREAWR